MFKLLISLLFIVVFMYAGSAFAASNVYLGIRNTVSTEPPGMLLDVVIDAPAYKSGLRTGDVILAFDGVLLGTDSTTYQAALDTALAGKVPGDIIVVHIWRPGPYYVVTVNGVETDLEFPMQELPEIIANAASTDVIELVVKNEPRELDVKVALGARPEGGQKMLPSNYEMFPSRPYKPELADVRPMIEKLVDKTGSRAQYEDLMARLDARATPDDGYRLPMVTYLLRDGLQCETMSNDIVESVKTSAAKSLDGAQSLLEKQWWLMDTEYEWHPLIKVRPDLSADEHLKRLEMVLGEAAMHVQAAFGGLTEEECIFLDENRVGITDIYKAENYIDADPSIKRFRNNVRIIELSKKIDYVELGKAQSILAGFCNENYLRLLEESLRSDYRDILQDSVLYEKETPLGWIVVLGEGSTWRNLPTDPAQYRHDLLTIDLGGDDFYSTTAGSGISLEYPIGMLIDFSGNDAYESTLHYSQGSGSMGCGLLVDMGGDDSYIGTQWAQGTGFLGCGTLIDVAGDDTYRGHEFCQSAAIFGMSLLYDIAGDDMMEGHNKVQAFGGARSVALLVDVEGNDQRYAKGTYATGYGDPGIFDSWSQGCGDGFRQYASGGIAGVIDFAGNDKCEAGNFSTGGGYYFGWGFYYDGAGDDWYIGSRYNQGFCAHQAVGTFLEMGGNDLYQTRQAVAQGLAWDECATVFVDYAGDDVYQGGGGFSQGASAHNALCVYRDGGGDDIYDYTAGQARAGGNDYHGGTSLSLFIDEGGGTDSYNWDVTASTKTDGDADGRTDANNLITGWKEYGFFMDIPGTLEEALDGDRWYDWWLAPAFMSEAPAESAG